MIWYVIFMLLQFYLIFRYHQTDKKREVRTVSKYMYHQEWKSTESEQRYERHYRPGPWMGMNIDYIWRLLRADLIQWREGRQVPSRFWKVSDELMFLIFVMEKSVRPRCLRWYLPLNFFCQYSIGEGLRPLLRRNTATVFITSSNSITHHDEKVYGLGWYALRVMDGSYTEFELRTISPGIRHRPATKFLQTRTRPLSAGFLLPKCGRTENQLCSPRATRSIDWP